MNTKSSVRRRFSAPAVAVAALLVGVSVAGGGAYAASKITGGDIKNNTVQSRDIKNNTIQARDVKNGAVGKADLGKGSVGWKEMNKYTRGKVHGIADRHSLKGAYYAQAVYDVGDTNAGAIATVACEAETDVAISGGVQVLGLDEGANARNTPVSSSFPGRMDWETNKPRPNRLDGWIVQFGGNAQQSGGQSDVNPEKTVIWALCVPGARVGVKQTYVQSAG